MDINSIKSIKPAINFLKIVGDICKRGGYYWFIYLFKQRK